MESTCITRQGDQWDIIARRVWGNELLADRLMKANMEHLENFTFGHGTVLRVPDLPESGAATGMPAWRS